MSGLDGLDALTQQREAAKRPGRAKRTMPPARHPRKAEAELNPVEPSVNPQASPDAALPTVPEPANQQSPRSSTTAQQDPATSSTGTASRESQADAVSPGNQVEQVAPSHAAAPEQSAHVAPTPQTRPPAASPAPRKSTAKRKQATAPAAPAATEDEPAGTDRVRPLTISLGEDDIDFLDEMRILGMQSRPRIDIGRSAVLRMALRRLRQEMTLEDIRDDIVARAAQSPAVPGRRRM